MIKAICEDPTLLLKTATITSFISLQLKATREILKQVRPSSDKKGHEGKSRDKDRNRPSIINAIFDRTEVGLALETRH